MNSQVTVVPQSTPWHGRTFFPRMKCRNQEILGPYTQYHLRETRFVPQVPCSSASQSLAQPSLIPESEGFYSSSFPSSLTCTSRCEREEQSLSQKEAEPEKQAVSCVWADPGKACPTKLSSRAVALLLPGSAHLPIFHGNLRPWSSSALLCLAPFSSGQSVSEARRF